MIHWGIIGCGFIAGRMAAVLDGRRDARLIGVASREKKKAAEFAARWRAPASYDSYEALARDPRVDAVYVATIHPAHAAAVRLCLEQGKAVLCEKPLAMNAREAEELFSLAGERRVLLMEAMWTRLLPVWQEIGRLCAEGSLGTILGFQADFSDAAPYDPSRRIFSAELGGGALLDLGVYCLHMAFAVLGDDYQTLTAVGRSAPTGVDAFAAMTLTFPRGAVAHLTCGSDVVGPRSACIMGDGGYIEVPSFFGAREMTVCRSGEAPQRRLFEEIDGFHYEIDEFHRLLNEGRTLSDSVPPAATLAVQRAMDDAMAQIRARG